MFKDVQTYIQSGNIVFYHYSLDSKRLALLLHEALQDKYDYDIPVLVMEHANILTLLKNNPTTRPVETLYFTLLHNIPTVTFESEAEHQDDSYSVHNQTVYISCQAYGKSKFSNAFFEKLLQITATTRNYKTLLKLSQM